jgi:HEAT repeat protein
MQNSHKEDLRQMIADYMENGFLENIIDMFRHDSALYGVVGELIRDERIRVRIGVTALMEELRRLDPDNIILAQKNLLPLLDHTEPVVRGDAANLLGIIGDKASLPYLEERLSDENENVRLIAREAIDEIRDMIRITVAHRPV